MLLTHLLGLVSFSMKVREGRINCLLVDVTQRIALSRFNSSGCGRRASEIVD